MIDILIAALTSGAVFSFVQFMITFGFSRKDKTKEIEAKLDLLSLSRMRIKLSMPGLLFSGLVMS